jgi:hypothetical protein
VRQFKVSEAHSYAQYARAIMVSFVKPRKRRWCYYQIVPDNIRYLTIERDGCVLYDSRRDVSCDMDRWEHSRAEHAAHWHQINRHSPML